MHTYIFIRAYELTWFGTLDLRGRFILDTALIWFTIGWRFYVEGQTERVSLISDIKKKYTELQKISLKCRVSL